LETPLYRILPILFTKELIGVIPCGDTNDEGLEITVTPVGGSLFDDHCRAGLEFHHVLAQLHMPGTLKDVVILSAGLMEMFRRILDVRDVQVSNRGIFPRYNPSARAARTRYRLDFGYVPNQIAFLGLAAH
jgi:hypothetical protein